LIYFDSSALVKLVHPELESAALGRWLDTNRDMRRVSSALIEVELPRAILRLAPHTLPAAARLMASIACVDITASIRAAAASVSNPLVRSLDAIHLATALDLGADVEMFVAYDRRLLTSAAELGLPTGSPGLQ
jgi:uncharacterized protein